MVVVPLPALLKVAVSPAPGAEVSVNQLAAVAQSESVEPSHESLAA
jgi:hypothetical protein